MAAPAAAQATPLPQGARLALVVLILINLVNYIDRYNLPAVESLIEQEPGFFQVGDAYVKTKIGSLFFAFMISYMLFSPLFGWLGDRYSRWRLISLGVLIWSLATFFCGFAGSFAVLFLLRCFVGIGEAAYGPAAPAIIADYYPVEKRGRAIAWFYAAIPVGGALGYLLGGQIAAIKIDGQALGWRWVFLLMGPPGLALAAWSFFLKDPPRGLSEAEGAAREGNQVKLSFWQEYALILRNRSYLLATLGMTAMAFTVGGVAFWMPRYIAQDREGGNLATVNTIYGGITVLAGLTATLAGGWLADRLRPKLPGAYFWVSGVGMLIGFVLFLAVLVVPFPACWFLLATAIFFLFLNTGPTNTILANVIHPRLRAAAVALNIFIIHAFGDAISPTIIGLIADLFPDKAENASWLTGLNAGFLVVSGMILASGLLWCWGAFYLEEDSSNAAFMLRGLTEQEGAPS